MRVLFVDDEVRVLEAIQRSLLMADVDWEMRFVTGGEAALAALASERFDVIVSDMRMPGMDGATLLTLACERDPGMVRIVLSGQADEESALSAARVAHQFLAKPCDAPTIRKVVERTGELHRTLLDPQLRALVGGVRGLPTTMRLFQDLSDLLRRDDASTDAVTALVRQDPAMASKLLQFVNSAFFANSREVADIGGAVVRLGMKTIKNLALGLGVFDMGDSVSPTVFSVDQMQRRAFTAARIAGGLAHNREQADAAFMAGLVCDLGELVLASKAPDRLICAWQNAEARNVARSVVEREIFGVSHAKVGACLLELWGLPFRIVEAVAHHHAPERSSQAGPGLPQIVWIASCVAAGEEPEASLIDALGAQSLVEKAQRLAAEH